MSRESTDNWERLRSDLSEIERLSQFPETSIELRTKITELRTQLDLLQAAWQKLELATREDPLTRVGNRRGFEEELRRAFGAADRYKTPLSVVLLDLDHFKSINDQQGHFAGDQVLRHVAGIIRDELRSSDSVSRYGGDEFAAILPSTPLGGALQLVARLRTKLSVPVRITEEAGEELFLEIGVSFGVASLEPTDREEWDLFRRCDQELMKAKNLTRCPPVSHKTTT